MNFPHCSLFVEFFSKQPSWSLMSLQFAPEVVRGILRVCECWPAMQMEACLFILGGPGVEEGQWPKGISRVAATTYFVFLQKLSFGIHIVHNSAAGSQESFVSLSYCPQTFLRRKSPAHFLVSQLHLESGLSLPENKYFRVFSAHHSESLWTYFYLRHLHFFQRSE